MSLGNYLCVSCKIEMRCAKNGAIAVSMGTQGPLEIYECDLWRCPDCGYVIVGGRASKELTVEVRDPDTTREEAIEAFVSGQLHDGNFVFRFWLNERERSEFVERFGPRWWNRFRTSTMGQVHQFVEGGIT